MKEFFQKLLMFFSGLKPAPMKNEPVVTIEPAPAPDWITLEQFRLATGLSAGKALEWYQHVRAACLEFDIVGPVRIAAFLPQVGHESNNFLWLSELWGPTAAQRRYDSRADLGNTRPEAIQIAMQHGSTPGSWWRGHGPIQITGFDNHKEAGEALGLDLLNHPKLITDIPENAARSAAWWWANNGCNEIADTGDFLALSRRINLGNAKSTKTPNGMQDRTDRWNRAKQYV